MNLGFIVNAVTGFDESSFTLQQGNSALLLWAVVSFVLLLIFPVLHYSLRMGVKGVFAGVFFTVAWLGIVLVAILLVFDVGKNGVALEGADMTVAQTLHKGLFWRSVVGVAVSERQCVTLDVFLDE